MGQLVSGFSHTAPLTVTVCATIRPRAAPSLSGRPTKKPREGGAFCDAAVNAYKVP